MAFNPFSNFRKYQKYWMASAVLVCMMTFVLCGSGMGSKGLDDWIIKLTRRHGQDYAKVNGRGYTYEDFSEIKNQRNIANDFMRELTKIAYDKIVDQIKKIKSAASSGQALDDNSQKILQICSACMEDLGNKYNGQQRYFQGGTKLDDLVDFILWRDLADKYDVRLTDDAVNLLVMQAVFATGRTSLWPFDSDISRELQYKLRGTHYNATDSAVKKAIRDEFRVQIMQLAYMGHWNPGPPIPVGQGQQRPLRDVFAEAFDLYLNTSMQYRIVPTPEQISSYYRKVRTDLTIDLLPVSLEELAKQEKLPEERSQKLEILKSFYKKYEKEPYNPTSDKPGFNFPARAEIQYIMADPDLDYYRLTAETLILLRKVPPVSLNLLNPLAGDLQWLAALPAWQATLQQNLEMDGGRQRYEATVKDYYRTLAMYNEALNKPLPADTKNEQKVEIELERSLKWAPKYKTLLDNPPPPYKYGLSPLTTAYFWNQEKFEEAEVKPNPKAVAGILGAMAGPDGPLAALALNKAAAYSDHLKQLEPMLATVKTQRIQFGSTMILEETPDLFGGSAFMAAALLYHAALEPQFEPVAGYLESELTKKVVKSLAQSWVNTVMLDCKKQLEAVKGREEPFKEQLGRLQRKYSWDIKDGNGKVIKTASGFQLHETAKLRSEYDIDQDPDLQPFQAAFEKYATQVNLIEGRAGKPEMLRKGDFAKLFFGSDYLGVGNTDAWVPKVWPPYANTPKQQLEDPFLAEKSREQRLFDKDEKPIIFWKSAKVGAMVQPWDETNERMVEFAEKQYRMFTARPKLMDEVKRLAKAVADAQLSPPEGKDSPTLMRELAAKHGTKVIVLKDVAQLVENQNRSALESINYVEYALPRNEIPFPRSDMVKDLLALHNLPAPLKIEDYKDLNDLNSSLFVQPKPGARPKLGQVQVLTNKPRTVYYVAMVTKVSEPEMFHYFETVLPQAVPGKSQNMFIDQVQIDYGKNLLKTSMEQLRLQAEVFISDEARKAFADSDQQAPQ
jgi:hypothetical protein